MYLGIIVKSFPLLHDNNETQKDSSVQSDSLTEKNQSQPEQKYFSKKQMEKYNTNKGEIEAECMAGYSPEKGDKVFVNGKPAPNGKYKIGFMNFIHVFNGIVRKNTSF